MSAAGELHALAERCEKATGPSDDLNLAIAEAVRAVIDAAPIGANGQGAKRFKSYSHSLDAAMTLVPEGWQGDRLHWWAGSPSICELIETHSVGGEWVREAGWLGRAGGKAATPALALCAAALRARAA